MNLTNRIIHFIKYFPACFSGFILTMSFPKISFSLLAWIGLVPLLISISKMNRKQSFYAGLLTGMCHFLSLLYWITPTVQTYGNLPLFLAFPILVLLSFYLSLYLGIFTLIFKSFKQNSILTPFKAAALWTGLEYIRSFCFTGFPWGSIGYSQYMQIDLIQVADITGIYGISFLIVLFNSGVCASFFMVGFYNKKVRIKKIISLFFCIFFIIGAVLIYGKIRLQDIDKAILKAPRKNITVVQGNISQHVKWDKSFKENIVKKYCNLFQNISHNNINETTDLVILPETALPFYYLNNKKLSSIVNKCIKKTQTSFLLGSPAFEYKNNKAIFYNRAYMINKSGVITGKYDKIHLVPFGEYVPLEDYFFFLGKIITHAGNFSSGEKNIQPLIFKDTNLGVLICFEIIFPELSADIVKNGADILVTITNDAWFGFSSAPLQHFSMSVFRAVENRRALVRSANTGISGFIDPVGRVIQRTNLFKEQVITKSVPCLKLKSFYTYYKDVFAKGCIIISLIMIVFSLFNRKNS